MKRFVFLSVLVSTTLHLAQAQLFEVGNGSISFASEAPLEIIRASSDDLKGLVNVESREFAFSIDISSFQGFNSPLQQVHFNENYMESKLHPRANFTGKIIESVDLTVPGNHDVRVKGQLLIHGVVRERIVRGTILRDAQGAMQIQCDFRVLLEEHNIRVPKVVQQKIAKSIAVSVKADLVERTNNGP